MADNSSSKSGRNVVTGKPFTAFEQAFFNARKAGDKTFSFRGKDYTTKLKSEHLLVDPPKPKPSAGSDTRNQSPPGPRDAPGGLYAGMTNPPERQPDQPTPEEVAQERVAQAQVPAGGALGLQGPGNPAAAPAQPPPGPVQGPPASPPPTALQGPGNPAGGGPPPGPADTAPVAQGGPAGPAGGGPHPQFDAELSAFQQRQAQAMQGQLAQPVGQGQAAGGPIGGPGTAGGYVPPSPGQGQNPTMQLPPGPQPIGGPGADAGPGPDPSQGGGAIDFQGLARYFYQLGMQAGSASKGAGNLGAR